TLNQLNYRLECLRNDNGARCGSYYPERQDKNCQDEATTEASPFFNRLFVSFYHTQLPSDIIKGRRLKRRALFADHPGQVKMQSYQEGGGAKPCDDRRDSREAHPE